MRYSYALTVAPEEVDAQAFPQQTLGYDLMGRYVELTDPLGDALDAELCPRSTHVSMGGGPHVYVWRLARVYTVAGNGGTFAYIIQPPGARAPTGPVFRGRLRAVVLLAAGENTISLNTLVVDAGASRFTGASIAGLVVGAMGFFIFGLYHRRWLIEMKALASESGRDMIA
jgi:hypothetical protein